MQAGLTAQPLRALLHDRRDCPQQAEGVLAVVVGEPGEQFLSAPEFHAAFGVDDQQAHRAGPHTGCQTGDDRPEHGAFPGAGRAGDQDVLT